VKRKQTKKRILLLNYEFPPLGGGAGNATYYLLKEFSKKQNIEIDLVTSSIEQFRIKKFSKNITIHFLDIGKKNNLHHQSIKDLIVYSWKAYKYCQELIKNKNFDLCHAFFGIPCGYLAMKFKKKHSLPYIVSLRGSDVPFYNKRFYYLDKLIFKKLSKKIWQESKCVISNSEDLKKLALNNNPQQKIEIINNGVDTNKFVPSKKNINKKLSLISTGRLIERKGYQYLIPAIKDLDVKLQLIGDGSLKSKLKEMARGIEVEFLGQQEQSKLIKYLQDADIFILPSLNEGMSNSLLEAMACGLPIITTNTGDSKKLIDGNGFLVKKENSESLKETIVSYLGNKELIVKHGKKSREIAKTMSWQKASEKYSEAIRLRSI